MKEYFCCSRSRHQPLPLQQPFSHSLTPPSLAFLSHSQRESFNTRSTHFHNLTPVPLPQPKPVPVKIDHAPRLTAIPRDAEPQDNCLLADQLVQIQELRLPVQWQFKRADQTARLLLDAVPRRRAAQGQVDAEHVDLTFAHVEEDVFGVEVELEAIGARARAREAAEDGDKVLLVRVAFAFGDFEVEGGAAGFGATGSLAGGVV